MAKKQTATPVNCPVPGMGKVKSKNVGVIVWAGIIGSLLFAALWSTGYGSGWLSTASLFGGDDETEIECEPTPTLQFNYTFASNFSVTQVWENGTIFDENNESTDITQFTYVYCSVENSYVTRLEEDYDAGHWVNSTEFQEYYQDNYDDWLTQRDILIGGTEYAFGNYSLDGDSIMSLEMTDNASIFDLGFTVYFANSTDLSDDTSQGFIPQAANSTVEAFVQQTPYTPANGTIEVVLQSATYNLETETFEELHLLMAGQEQTWVNGSLLFI